MQLELFDV